MGKGENGKEDYSTNERVRQRGRRGSGKCLSHSLVWDLHLCGDSQHIDDMFLMRTLNVDPI